MVAAMISSSNAPRDLAGLMSLTRSVRQRLAYQLAMLTNSDQENAFNAATDEEQSQALLTALQILDANAGAAPADSPQTQGAPHMTQLPNLPPVVPPQTGGFAAPGLPATGPSLQQPQGQLSGMSVLGPPGMPVPPPVGPPLQQSFPMVGGMPAMNIPSGMPQRVQAPPTAAPGTFPGMPGMPPMGAPQGAPGSFAGFPAAGPVPGLGGFPTGGPMTGGRTPSVAPVGAPASPNELATAIEPLLNAVKELTANLKAAVEGNQNVATTLFNTAAAQKTDIDLVLRIQLYYANLTAQQLNVPVDQLLAHMGQFIATVDPRLIDQIRATLPQQAPQASGKG